jgi:hypothetical protein
MIVRGVKGWSTRPDVNTFHLYCLENMHRKFDHLYTAINCHNY